jgi:hypothetical protein
MASPVAAKPATAAAVNRLQSEQLGRQLYSDHYTARNVRRQYLAAHLHSCGPRPVLEALIAVAVGQCLDQVLADFARVPAAVYSALGADELQIHALTVIDGGAAL